MRWSESTPMDERLQFVADVLGEIADMSALCRRRGISRKTGYKWLARYAARGAAGPLAPAHSRSHRPNSLSRIPRIALKPRAMFRRFASGSFR